MTRKKLAVVATHPIQYYAPLFRLLTQRGRADLKVFYTWSQTKEKVNDAGFGKAIKWDIPLLEGYKYEFVENSAESRGRSFWSIKNPDLVKTIKDFNPDALLVFGWNFYSHLQVMRYFKGTVPVWFRGDSHLLDENPGLKTIARRLFLKWIYRHVDRAFYVGKNSKNYFLKHGLKEEQLVFAPHAIDNQRFFDDDEKQYEEKAKTWRKELGYKKGDIVIVYAGKFEPVKNLELLLEAFNGIYKNDAQIKLRLLLIGNGILESQFKGIAARNPFVCFLPFQNQSTMPLIYRLGDVFCLPSKSETWGLAVNEAMACGRPVIVSNKVGCSIDLVKQGKTGFIFNYHDRKDLEECLFSIDKKNLELMGEAALDHITPWNYTAICEALEQELDK